MAVFSAQYINLDVVDRSVQSERRRGDYSTDSHRPGPAHQMIGLCRVCQKCSSDIYKTASTLDKADY